MSNEVKLIKACETAVSTYTSTMFALFQENRDPGYMLSNMESQKLGILVGAIFGALEAEGLLRAPEEPPQGDLH